MIYATFLVEASRDGTIKCSLCHISHSDAAASHHSCWTTKMFDLGMSMEKLVLQEQSKNPKDIKEDHVDLSVGVQLQPFHELLYLFMESWCSVDVTVTQAH